MHATVKPAIRNCWLSPLGIVVPVEGHGDAAFALTIKNIVGDQFPIQTAKESGWVRVVVTPDQPPWLDAISTNETQVRSLEIHGWWEQLQ